MIFTSIFGIVTLVMLARALGFAKAPALVDAEEAMRVANNAIPGFGAVDAELAPGGRGALVRSCDGSVAAVRPHGDRWVVRLQP